jgi:osmoprotectant transport system ATP-binding protein
MSMPAPISAPSISFESVSKRYRAQDGPVVDGVTLHIQAGSFVVVVGASGSGKTTLLKMINGLISPSTGAVLLDGRDVAGLDGPTLRRSIGYIFQGIGLFPHLSLGENIAITLRLLGWSEVQQQARMNELLDLVGLPRTFASRLPAALSGGQRQRIGVARALAAEPKLLLMDEPFGALDPITRDDLASATRTLHDRLGLTTVMVTHDMQEALLIADRIIVMGGGTVIADDTPRALLAGHTDPAVMALIETPKRQAQRLGALAL